MAEDSVTMWLRQFGSGDQEAAFRLWKRYSPALMRLAMQRHRGAISPVADEEDLVQSVFRALWTGGREGRWDAVENRSELWWLLVTITRRKAINRRAYNKCEKRDGVVVSLSEAESGAFDSTDVRQSEISDDHPPPELILMLEEEQQRLLSSLRDDVLRSIAVWKLEGFTHEEIAAKLGVTNRTVIRKINLIREAWIQDLPA